MKIPIIKPEINTEKVFSNLKEVFDSGILTRGAFVQKFEDQLKEFLGVKYAFAVTSGTTALHLALIANDIKDGDEVLVSDFSFPATANVIVQAGARPIFVDIDLKTLCMDPMDLEKKITSKTKAIMVVHAFGYPANMTRINEIADNHNLVVIEDAACALGSFHQDKLCGTLSQVGCFSFHPRKVITTAEGGAVVTNNDAIAEKLELYRNHGMKKNDIGEVEFLEAGFNYRLSELQAALGVEQMESLEVIEKSRLEKAQKYLDELKNVSGLEVIEKPEDGKNNYQSFVVLLKDEVDREDLMKKLKEKGIETTIGTYAMHAQPAFSKYGYKPGDLPNSYLAFKKTLSLPLYVTLTNEEQNYVITEIKNIL